MRVRGFTEVARQLSDMYGEKVTRQRVYEWWKRETRNADGKPFPRELSYDPEAPANRPNREFDMEAVLAWTRPGVPANFATGYRKLGRE